MKHDVIDTIKIPEVEFEFGDFSDLISFGSWKLFPSAVCVQFCVDGS